MAYLGHVSLVVKSIDKANELYKGVFEMEAMFDMEMPVEHVTLHSPTAHGAARATMLVGDSGTCIEMAEYADAEQGDIAGTRRYEDFGVTHFCLMLDDCASTVEQIRALGLDILTEPFTDPDSLCVISFVRDFDKNVIELVGMPVEE